MHCNCNARLPLQWWYILQKDFRDWLEYVRSLRKGEKREGP